MPEKKTNEFSRKRARTNINKSGKIKNNWIDKMVNLFRQLNTGTSVRVRELKLTVHVFTYKLYAVVVVQADDTREMNVAPFYSGLYFPIMHSTLGAHVGWCTCLYFHIHYLLFSSSPSSTTATTLPGQAMTVVGCERIFIQQLSVIPLRLNAFEI